MYNHILYIYIVRRDELNEKSKELIRIPTTQSSSVKTQFTEIKCFTRNESPLDIENNQESIKIENKGNTYKSGLTGPYSLQPRLTNKTNLGNYAKELWKNRYMHDDTWLAGSQENMNKLNRNLGKVKSEKIFFKDYNTNTGMIYIYIYIYIELNFGKLKKNGLGVGKNLKSNLEKVNRGFWILQGVNWPTQLVKYMNVKRHGTNITQLSTKSIK